MNPCGQNIERTIPRRDFPAKASVRTTRSRLTWTAYRSESRVDGQKSPSCAAVADTISKGVARKNGRDLKQLVDKTEVAHRGVRSF